MLFLNNHIQAFSSTSLTRDPVGLEIVPYFKQSPIQIRRFVFATETLPFYNSRAHRKTFVAVNSILVPDRVQPLYLKSKILVSVFQHSRRVDHRPHVHGYSLLRIIGFKDLIFFYDLILCPYQLLRIAFIYFHRLNFTPVGFRSYFLFYGNSTIVALRFIYMHFIHCRISNIKLVF